MMSRKWEGGRRVGYCRRGGRRQTVSCIEGSGSSRFWISVPSFVMNQLIFNAVIRLLFIQMRQNKKEGKSEVRQNYRQTLELEPVSQYSKEMHSRRLKQRHRNRSDENAQDLQGYSLNQMGELVKTTVVQNYGERQFEDSHVTKFVHEQLILIKLSLTLLAVMSIFLSLTQSFFNFDPDADQLMLMLYSVISLCMVVLVFCKQGKQMELREKQLIGSGTGNIYVKYLRSVWFQVLLFTVHPNLLAQGVVIYMEEPIYAQILPVQLNTLLEVVMLSRVYLFYSALVSTSLFCTTRASRMCRIYSTKREEFFGAKSVFNSHPLGTLLVLYVSLVIIYSQMLALAEKTAPNFANFQNVVWCVIVTMGTIGYGDYYPTTYLGRIVAFASAISGIILASLLIVTLSQYLTMSARESKSHVTLKRLQFRKLVQQYAEETIMATTAMGIRGSSESIHEVKRKSQMVKLAMRRLKNMIDTDNLAEEINNLFESLYGNLMQIYMQQQKYSQELMRLSEQQRETIQRIDFTFPAQIENIIRER